MDSNRLIPGTVLNECFSCSSVFAQMSHLQPVRVYGLDDLAEQRAKSAGDNLLARHRRGLAQVLVDIARQVDQAFLLSAWYRIIPANTLSELYSESGDGLKVGEFKLHRWRDQRLTLIDPQ